MIPFIARLRYPLGAPSADGQARSKIPLRIVGGAACVAICAAVAALPPGGSAPARGQRTPGVTAAMTRATVVSSLASSGPGTLRSALDATNAGPPGTSATIRFRVHATITLLSPLPAVSRPVAIDGTSAPTYRGGAPVVAINCNRMAGLRFQAGSARARLLGLAVDNAGGDGVTLNAGAPPR